VTHEPVGAVPKRRGVKKADRDRIGERDGWICCFCRRSVDKDHVWQKSVKPGPELVEQAAAILSQGVDERITAWAGTDIGRVLAVFSAWPKNPYWEPYVEASRSAQELRRELSELRYPNSRDEARKAELTPLIEEAEEACNALSAQATDRYERHRPHYEVLEAVRAVYRQRNKDHPSAEHRIPVIAGGTNSKENLAIAHLGCNLKRGGNSLLIADLMIANHKGIPIEGRAAFVEDQQRRRDEFEQQRLEGERRRREWARGLCALWDEYDELRRELRRLGDRLRKTPDENERRKIQNRRGRIKAKRVKLRRNIDRARRDHWWMSEEDVLRYASLPREPEVRPEEVGEVVVESALAMVVELDGDGRGMLGEALSGVD
jgi:hypothetical protein